MMQIIQEIPSFDGVIHTNVIENVLGVSKADNQYLRGFKMPQWVIWCRLPAGKTYPIAGFPNSRKRDEVYVSIKDSSNSTIVLEYNDCFTDSYMTAKQVRDSLLTYNTRLQPHLKGCMTRIINNHNANLVSLLELDAFADFSITHMHRWNEDTPMIIDVAREIKYSRIWAKCLYTPRKYLNMGMTPLQFFHHLIKLNNEEVNNYVSNGGNGAH